MRKLLITSLVILLPQSYVFAKTIVVIGAGLAGLTTAYDLQKAIEQKKLKDMNVQVFEAKGRVGGRVFTVQLNGRAVELGGENINDGGEAQTLRRLARELNVRIQSRKLEYGKSFFVDPQTEKKYDTADLKKYFPKITEQELTKTLSEAEAKSKNANDVLDFFFNRYHSDDQQTQTYHEILRRMSEEFMLSYEGGDVHTLSPRYAHGSLHYFLSRFIRKTEKPYAVESFIGGNSQLTLALEKKLGTKIHLNQPLRKMDINPNGGFDLTFDDNKQKVHADTVVLALPCKPYRDIRFSPEALDPKLVHKIISVGYGTHAKILVSHSPISQNTRILTRDVEMWSAPDETWRTFYYSGAAGVMKTQKELQRSYQTAMKVADLTAQEKIEIQVPQTPFSSWSTPVAMSWATDPYIQGSYSYFAAVLKQDLETTVMINGEAYPTLFAPIREQIYFAGEHTTADHDIRGTMEAAAASGARSARSILNTIKN